MLLRVVTKEGPPPFKAGTPPVPYPEMLANMGAALGAAGLTVAIDEAMVTAAMEAGAFGARWKAHFPSHFS